MDIKKTLKTSVAVGALAAAAPLAFSSVSEAGGIKNQNGKLDLTVGGQIVRALMYVDDGRNSHIFQTDGVTTGTRVRYIMSGQLTESVKVSGLLEHDVGQSNDPGNSTFDANGADSTGDSTAFGIRHHDIKFSHKSLGAISIGRGNAASNGRSEVSLAGTGAMVLGPDALGSGVLFVNSNTNVQTALTLGAQGNHFDGASRTDRVRYDAPTFMGLGLSASVHETDGAWDVAAGYSGKFAGVKIKAGAHYLSNGGTGDTATWGVSGGLLHDSGLNVDGGYARQILGNSNAGGGRSPTWAKLGIGYIAKLSNLGATHFHLEFHQSDDNTAKDRELETIYLTAVQKLSAIGSEVGITWAHYELEDTTGASYDDIDVVYFQTKLNF